MIEIIKEGFEGIYYIGEDFNIYRAKPHKNSKDKENYPRKLAEKFDKDGYPVVSLCNNGKAFQYRKHRLIAEAMIPNPNNFPEVNHKNGIKTDCSVENLEWVTHRENNLHALRTGLRIMKNNKLSKKVGQFDLKGNFIKEYPSANEVHRQTGYSQSHVSECCRGDKLKTYKGFVWKYI